MKRMGIALSNVLRLAVLTAVLASAPTYAAESLPSDSYSAKRLPPWVEAAWAAYRSQRSAGELQDAAATLVRVRRQAEEEGYQGFDLLSAVMIQEGEEALSQGRKAEAVGQGLAAEQWSPNNPNVSLFLAKALFYQYPFKPFSALRHYINGLAAAAHDFWFSFYILGRLILIVLAGFVGSSIVFLAFLLIRYLPLLTHSLFELANTALNEAAVRVLIAALLLMPMIAGAGIGFVLLAALCSIWLFMTWSERIIGASMVLVWSFAFLWLPAVMPWYAADQSEALRFLTQVARGDGAAYDTARLIDRRGGFDHDWPLQFSRVVQKKREGHYEEALEGYRQLQKLEPNRSLIPNNMGNIYFLMKQYEPAVAAYKQAVAQNPRDATAYYNLNLVFREMLRFEEAKDAYESAQQIDLSLVQSRLGRIPIDELLPSSVLWSAALSAGTISQAQSRELYGKFLNPLPLKNSPLLFLIFIGGAAVLRRVFPRKRTATVCALCNRPICLHCQRRILDLKTCGDCWDGSKNAKRKEDLRQIKIRRQRTRRRVKILSLVFPGTGHLALGAGTRGFVLIMIFMSILFAVFFSHLLFRIPGEGAVLGFGSGLIILFGLILVYMEVFRLLAKTA